MTKNPQPAIKSYFFSKGYVDLLNTIKGAWRRNGDSIKKYVNNCKNIQYDDFSVKVLKFVANLLAGLAVIVCGSVITAVITVINVVILLAFMLLVYIGFTAIWCVDRLYLTQKKIFTACHECKEKSLIPVYHCSNCSAKHTNLTPGVYGILHRRCECGQKLPTVFFNGRKNLTAECPSCGFSLTDRESRPLCIPVVGGRSVGKTAFITAFSKEFLEVVAPSKGMTCQFYNQNKEEIYKEICMDYSAGSTRMTARPQDIRQASSVSFSFFAQHKNFSPERLIHVYDIAGEVFTDNNENEVQKQYEYCQGIVLIIDPFAIPSVHDKYLDKLSAEDVAGIGKADVNQIINSFLNKLREVTGLSDSKAATVPLAVVISKIDSAELKDEIGETAVQRLMSSNPDKFSDKYNTEDYLCRKFLLDNEMGSFLNNVTIQFKTNRFFACSAIGHTRDQGSYEPRGVLPPMQWLFAQADPKMGQVWNDITFPKQIITD